ncbi:MAG: hypothetical protein B9S38_17235 [Verrucomicrobiia bacterium Tous-C4TDCM]|nr:MAG: hypothetical protein B9S38_17235 [Verrucomicrobiae bacterium Tous-C4TDCM]
MKRTKCRPVAAYDLATNAVFEMPRAKLGRGMIQVCPQSEAGLYWVDAKEWLFKSGPTIGPPLRPSQEGIVRIIRVIFGEVFDHPEEEWFDGLRRSENANYEIGMWLALSELYDEFAVDLSLPGRRELFRLLMACEHCPLHLVPLWFDRSVLEWEFMFEVIHGFAVMQHPELYGPAEEESEFLPS